MRWNESRDQDQSMSDVNLTPLIDVSLVLVVILLLATPLAFESNFGVRKTQASARQADREVKDPRIELTILSDEEVRINKDVVPMKSFGRTFGEVINQGGSRDVTVTCGDDVSHGIFVRVLDLSKLNGARDIAVAGS